LKIIVILFSFFRANQHAYDQLHSGASRACKIRS
jgi:hypothetical protein